MTDRYEEFKEWLFAQMYRSPALQGIDWITLFNMFEDEQSEKQKEEEIKQIISRGIYCADYSHLPIGKQEKVSNIYDEIKEKDLIK